MQSRRAFTLIEILIAIMIFSLAVGGVLGVFASAAQARARALNRTNAAVIATRIITKAKCMFERKTPIIGAVDFPVASMTKYRYDLETYPVDKYGFELFVRVNVKWSNKGTDCKETFETMFYRDPRNDDPPIFY